MKASYLALTLLVTMVTLLVGCPKNHHHLVGFFKSRPHRVVTISLATPGDLSVCEVDFPVSLLRMAKRHTIAWAAEDHDYWIVFDASTPNPLPTTEPIYVQQGTQTANLPIAGSTSGYYMYAIYDADPRISQPCKTARDDRDTGLNVKR